ncbi:MAG: GNAT family N-acetyltransferase [Marinobacterium sp.]|nr:GNAT family N-acetyltransferase [Marinobacterium sp.]
MRVRAADHDDLHQVASIHALGWLYTYGHNPSHPTPAQRFRMWEQVLRESYGRLIVAENDAAITGFIHTMPCRDSDLKGHGFSPAKITEITALYVHPDYYGKGTGFNLLCTVTEQERATGMRGISLWVAEDNNRAISFYERNGFIGDGSRSNPDDSGICDIRMQKTLELHHNRPV